MGSPHTVETSPERKLDLRWARGSEPWPMIGSQGLGLQGGLGGLGGFDGHDVAEVGEPGDELVLVPAGVLAAGVESLAELGGRPARTG